MTQALTTLISVEQLHAQLDNPNWVVIDCRFSLADTSQGGIHFSQSRIPGAQYAHLDKQLSSSIIADVTGRHPLPDVQTLEAQFQKWGINNDTQIIAYDDKPGAIASRLWWLSRWLGHEACAVLDGGLVAWKQAGLPLDTNVLNSSETDSVSTDAIAINDTSGDTRSDDATSVGDDTTNTLIRGAFQRQTPLAQVIEKPNVLDDNLCLLDAREAERYRGEVEPIDPVAGHIPGALNAPFMNNLNADGTFKSVGELQERFDPILAQSTGKQLVHYCGSGVTAAHNMLAMVHAQRNPGAMYAGSFSEWVSPLGDDQFPVARLVD